MKSTKIIKAKSKKLHSTHRKIIELESWNDDAGINNPQLYLKKSYYLAYGSNLNIEQMYHRCPGARIVGVGEINDYHLLFRCSKTGAYLTIEPCKGESVPVAVFEVTYYDKISLDIYEGCPVFYYRTNMNILMHPVGKAPSKEIKAFVYIMHEDRDIGIPSKNYILKCLKGYDFFGFNPQKIADAIRVSANGVAEKITKGGWVNCTDNERGVVNAC